MLLDLPRGLVTLVTFTGGGRPLKFERGLEIPPYQPRSGSTSSVAAKPGEAVGRRRSVRRSAVGSEILLSEKFDAVIVDCDDLQGGLEVLQELRKGTSNRNSVAFAILNGKTTASQAFQMGANFVLQKPISPLNSMRCFNAALGFMYREQRRYFRHPVEMPIVI